MQLSKKNLAENNDPNNLHHFLHHASLPHDPNTILQQNLSLAIH